LRNLVLLINVMQLVFCFSARSRHMTDRWLRSEQWVRRLLRAVSLTVNCWC